MKHKIQFIILLLAIITSIGNATAQSPQEQLQQLVAQLQKTPTDNALRERIIKLAASMKPAPAISDTAIEFEGRARFAFKSAKSETDYFKAAEEYEKAISAAPWVSGYYSDICTIYEKASRFEDAKRNCEFYLVSLSDPAEITDAKLRIAGLKYGIEKASADVAKAQQEKAAAEKAEAERLARPDFSGKWGELDGNGIFEFLILADGTVAVRRTLFMSKIVGPYIGGHGRISGRTVEGRFEPVAIPGESYPQGSGPFRGVLSEDNQSMVWTFHFFNFPDQTMVLKRQP